MRRSLFLALAALVALPALAVPAAAAHDGDQGARVIAVSTRGDGAAHRHIALALNKAAIIELDADARDVLVSNPDIVDAVVRSPRRIFLLAKKSGETNAFFFDGNGRQLLAVDIEVQKDVTDLSGLIRDALPNSDVKVTALNDHVVLEGTVGSDVEAKRAQDLAASFTGDATKIVNLLRVTGGAQVMLKVRIAEMSRQIAKQFGIDLSAAGVVAGVPLTGSTSNPYGLMGAALSDLSGGQLGQVCTIAANQCTGGPNNIQGTFKALETVGLMHTLAEPNLTAVSGETAKFLAGGEFPVPSGRDQQGNVSISFKQFGVGLSFTPVVLSGGRISLQLSTEVSELTNTGAFTMSGASGTGPNGQIVTSPSVTIPALAVRRAETTVEVPSGGSFAIAGLLQHTTKQELDAFPGLKDMPILGALFRSRDFQNNETELVVLVTAYLVKPTTEAKLAAPTDGFVMPTDLETIFLGRLNAIYKRKDHPIATPSGKVGFIVQ